jgi:hypothetical protein
LPHWQSRVQRRHDWHESEERAVVPELFARDVRVGVTLYRDKLGFRVERSDLEFAVLTLGEGVIFLADDRLYLGPKGEPRGSRIDVRFVVSDVDG